MRTSRIESIKKLGIPPTLAVGCTYRVILGDGSQITSTDEDLTVRFGEYQNAQSLIGRKYILNGTKFVRTKF